MLRGRSVHQRHVAAEFRTNLFVGRSSLQRRSAAFCFAQQLPERLIGIGMLLRANKARRGKEAKFECSHQIGFLRGQPHCGQTDGRNADNSKIHGMRDVVVCSTPQWKALLPLNIIEFGIIYWAQAAYTSISE
jgi:hypothetical protein